MTNPAHSCGVCLVVDFLTNTSRSEAVAVLGQVWEAARVGIVDGVEGIGCERIPNVVETHQLTPPGRRALTFPKVVDAQPTRRLKAAAGEACLGGNGGAEERWRCGSSEQRWPKLQRLAAARQSRR